MVVSCNCYVLIAIAIAIVHYLWGYAALYLRSPGCHSCNKYNQPEPQDSHPKPHNSN